MTEIRKDWIDRTEQTEQTERLGLTDMWKDNKHIMQKIENGYFKYCVYTILKST